MNPFELMSQGNLSMEQLIDQIKDPQTKMMAQMMAKQQAEKKQPALVARPVSQPEVQTMRHDIQELIRVNKNLIQEQRLLQQQHEQLKSLNTTVASAMGACACWGQNVACPDCGGQGIPGTQAVNQAAFGQLIAPFFQTLMGQMESFKQQALP